MFLLTPFTLYIHCMVTTLYVSKVQHIICSLFWFVIVFYIFLYMQKNSAQISLNTTKSKNFSHRKCMHHVICTLCIMHACMVYTRPTPAHHFLFHVILFKVLDSFFHSKPTTDIHHMRICTRISDEKKLYLLLIHREVSCFCLWNKIQYKVFA